MGVAAAEKLFVQHGIDRGTIDFLLFCTQTPDYPLPTTACLMQDRLGLPTAIGALDFNLGCSGFVYGLSLANGLIQTGAARRVLLVTAETYSKFIDPTDRSLRTIFGDGAAATLVEASQQPSLGSFVFGTDGGGGNMLMVAEGGARRPAEAIQSRKRRRWPSSLYMDGPELVKFSLEVGAAAGGEGPVAGPLERRQGGSVPDPPGHAVHAQPPPRAARAGPRPHARGAGTVRQHGFLDHSDPDPRSAPVGPLAAGQANDDARLRRRAVLGRLRWTETWSPCEAQAALENGVSQPALEPVSPLLPDGENALA